MAQAWACLEQDYRPIAGVVEINHAFSLLKIDSDYHMKYTLIHEISHVLGFSEYYFDKFDFIYSENKNVDVVNYLNSPKVIEKVEKAKLHFKTNKI